MEFTVDLKFKNLPAIKYSFIFLFLCSDHSFAKECAPEKEDPQKITYDNCKGYLKYQDGSTYEGWFFKENRHGYGKYYYSDGRVYEGNWEAGLPNGKGQLKFKNNATYKGDFHNGKITGFGELVNAYGDRYIGEFKDGKMHGSGKLTTLRGFNYQGKFLNDYIVLGSGILFKTPQIPAPLGTFCPGQKNKICPKNEDSKNGSLSLAPKRSNF